MPAKRPLKVPAAVWRVASTFLNPENLIAAWEHLNKDDRVLEFFRSIHPSKALSPIARIEAQLDAMEGLLASGLQIVPSTSLVNEWQRTLSTLRIALPLVKTAKGKSKREKIKDLQSRVTKLQDDIYAHLLATNVSK